MFLREIRVALGFLTILPVSPVKLEPDDFGNSVKYFPLVGMLNGFFVWVLLRCLSKILPGDIAAWLTIFAAAYLNGFIHWDGFADLADSLGGKTAQKRMEIMKDSRLGAFGAIALIFLVLGKVLMISKLNGYELGIFISIFSLSRWAMAMQIYTQPSVSQGLLRYFKVKHRYYDLGVTTLMMLITLIFGWPHGLRLLGVTLFVLFAVCLLARKKFGGISGDILGAGNELVELACLLTLNLKL